MGINDSLNWLARAAESAKKPQHAKGLELGVLAAVNPGEYPLNYDVHGIAWNPKYFADLRVSLRNDTNLDYEALDIVINLDDSSQFAKFSQVTAIPNVLFIPGDVVSEAQLKVRDQSGQNVQLLVPQGPSQSVRVLCPLLPSKTYIELIFAVVDVGLPQKFDPSPKGIQAWKNKIKERGDLFAKGNPGICHLKGQFTAAGAIYDIEQTINLK